MQIYFLIVELSECRSHLGEYAANRGRHGKRRGRGIKRFFVTAPSLAKGDVRVTIAFSAFSVFSASSAIQTVRQANAPEYPF